MIHLTYHTNVRGGMLPDLLLGATPFGEYISLPTLLVNLLHSSLTLFLLSQRLAAGLYLNRKYP